MKIGKKITIYIIFILAVVIFIKIPDGNTQPLSDSATPKGLIPENISIQEIYQPAFGTPIGKIKLIQGSAIIIHSDDTNGYIVKQNLPIFKKDTLITTDKSRLNFILLDGSIMTMASNSKMKLTEAVFNKETKIRTSFISMALGKVRFIVQKLKNFKESKFTIKTKTAVVGIRGSDFIINAAQTTTEVTTLDDTVLEIISLENLESPPVVLQDFEQIHVESGFLPSDIIPVSPEIIQDMIMDMTIIPEKLEPENLTHIQKQKFEKKDIKPRVSNILKIPADKEKPHPAKPDDLNSGQVINKPTPAIHESGVKPSLPLLGAEHAQMPLISPDSPIEKGFNEAINNSMPKPGEMKIPIEPEKFVMPEIHDEERMSRQEDFIKQENEKIIERTVEDIKRLPELPKPPY